MGLVGTTGAGKSTFVKLAARFYDPTQGRVVIDGIPLTDMAMAPFRAQLGYVPQEPFLFSGTVFSNIRYPRPNASDLEVEKAARAVGAHDFIAGLPQGYLTPVLAGGRSLSAGQRQLLCLARAELVQPKVLILDEATANLDLDTEAEVQRAMRRVARGRDHAADRAPSSDRQGRGPHRRHRKRRDRRERRTRRARASRRPLRPAVGCLPSCRPPPGAIRERVERERAAGYWLLQIRQDLRLKLAEDMLGSVVRVLAGNIDNARDATGGVHHQHAITQI